MDTLILIGSKINQDSIQRSLGKPEYSYFFLMKEFIPALQRLGTVVEVKSLDEVDALYDLHSAQGRKVIFLSFSPPQQTPLGLRCPTVPVFAWEFDSIPDMPWGDDPRDDWSYVFERTGAALTLSQEAADSVRKAMGEHFPIEAIPAPVWDRFADRSLEQGQTVTLRERMLRFVGEVFDSSLMGLSADGLVQPSPSPDATVNPVQPSAWRMRWNITRALAKGWWSEVGAPFFEPPSPAPAADASALLPEPVPVELTLRGVVYTAVINPGDHRKNWLDMVSAFCWNFRYVADATLVVKMTHHDPESYRVTLMTLLSRLAPFHCRVVVIHGFLEASQYSELVELSTFYVNTSVCEGLCLPLMEFLSCGKPAIAPRHTAMLDYLDESLAFIVDSARQPASWPHDSRALLTASLHRLNWESLVQAYQTSYEIAKSPQCYQIMSARAAQAMRDYCSIESVNAALGPFLERQLSPSAAINLERDMAR